MKDPSEWMNNYYQCEPQTSKGVIPKGSEASEWIYPRSTYKGLFGCIWSIAPFFRARVKKSIHLTTFEKNPVTIFGNLRNSCGGWFFIPWFFIKKVYKKDSNKKTMSYGVVSSTSIVELEHILWQSELQTTIFQCCILLICSGKCQIQVIFTFNLFILLTIYDNS